MRTQVNKWTGSVLAIPILGTVHSPYVIFGVYTTIYQLTNVKKEPAYTIIVAFSVLALLRNLLLLFSWFYSFVNSKLLTTAWGSHATTH